MQLLLVCVFVLSTFHGSQANECSVAGEKLNKALSDYLDAQRAEELPEYAGLVRAIAADTAFDLSTPQGVRHAACTLANIKTFSGLTSHLTIEPRFQRIVYNDFVYNLGMIEPMADSFFRGPRSAAAYKRLMSELRTLGLLHLD